MTNTTTNTTTTAAMWCISSLLALAMAHHQSKREKTLVIRGLSKLDQLMMVWVVLVTALLYLTVLAPPLDQGLKYWLPDNKNRNCLVVVDDSETSGIAWTKDKGRIGKSHHGLLLVCESSKLQLYRIVLQCDVVMCLRPMLAGNWLWFPPAKTTL